MFGWDPVGCIGCSYNYGSRDAEGPEFIRCVDGRAPQIHEIWALREDGVTRKFHRTAQVNVSAGVIAEFMTDYLTETLRRIPFFK